MPAIIPLVIGLSGVAAGVVGSKLAGKKKDAVSAPGPVTAPAAPAVPATPAPSLLTPPDAARARSDAQAPALFAAKKARAKAGAGTPNLLGAAPTATPTLQPKTLLGYSK